MPSELSGGFIFFLNNDDTARFTVVKFIPMIIPYFRYRYLYIIILIETSNLISSSCFYYPQRRARMMDNNTEEVFYYG